jgi:hypothetical protein
VVHDLVAGRARQKPREPAVGRARQRSVVGRCLFRRPNQRPAGPARLRRCLAVGSFGPKQLRSNVGRLGIGPGAAFTGWPVKGESTVATQETEDGSCLPVAAEPVVELSDERECPGLAAGGGVGRSGCTGRFGSPVLAVSYGLYEGQSVLHRFCIAPWRRT